MSGHRPFNELTKDFTPRQWTRTEQRAAELREEMALSDVRRALEISQEELAGRLAVKQPAVAKLERRGDMHVSKLRGLIEAMGGRLRVVAEFPQGEVTITNFSGSGDERGRGPKAN